jgi:hypothetical protein
VKQVTAATVNNICVGGEFKIKQQSLNNMNLVPVTNKLTFNSFSAFIKTDQACYSRGSIFLLSATDKSSLLVNAGTTPNSLKGIWVFEFFVQINVENKYSCLCITNLVI